MIFDYVLKCELHFLIIMMLVVVIRSIIREHDHTSRSYLLCCCYTLIFATVLRLAISFLDGSRYMELQYALQSLDCIVWCFLPFTWLVTVMSKLGFYDITQSLSIKLALILPLALTVCLSIISPFYPLIFKFNLFNEPVACQYSFIYYMMLAFYGVTSCLLTFYRMYAFSKAGERRESLFLFIASIVLLVMHHHYTFTGNIFYHVALMIILVFYYMNIHEDKFFTDPLTGLNNRNRFRKYLSQILSSQSAKTNMYLTYIDIDDFKKINDNYGHLTGDLALRTVSESMREIAAQSHSFIARIGGDEFAIISFHTDKIALQAMINRLTYTLNEKARANFKDFTVSFSIGTTSLNQSNVSMNDLIKIADRNMYRQKMIRKKSIARGEKPVNKVEE